MRVISMRLLNWLCFRGEHILHFEAKPYAVVAQYETDTQRSNWAGKSALLEAIDFALWGRHRAPTEDEWITHGEPVGEVRIEFDDGSIVTRSRSRGKRTTLMFTGRGHQNGALKDEAQKIIEKLVGLSSDDFLMTSYFQQRQMARFILADPAPRTEIVSGWLRLGPIERCAEKATSRCSELIDQLQRAEAQRANLNDLETQALGEYDRATIEFDLSRHEEIVQKRAAYYEETNLEIVRNAELLGVRGRVEDFDRLVEEGRKLREEVNAIDGDALKAAHEASREHEIETGQRVRMAKSQVAEKRHLAQGRFDGQCPVAGIECPATDQINKDRTRGLKLLSDAETTYNTARPLYDEACRDEASRRASLQAFERQVSKLQILREQAARLEAGYEEARQAGEPIDPQALRLRLESAAKQLDSARSAYNALKSRIDTLDQIIGVRETLDERIRNHRAIVATAREAAVIFGKQGAQRRIAEGALAEIEEAANHLLQSTSIDLTVTVRWSREGSGIARSCPACGHPFPSSTKVKVCERCQAARGANLVNKLDVVLSDRSGAAEDLAGIAIQLSAGEWLRADRGSSWAVLMLDEPMGSCDPYHRRVLGQRLATLLQHGSEQAFVIAHDRQTLESFPGRIEITSSANGSTVKVT